MSMIEEEIKRIINDLETRQKQAETNYDRYIHNPSITPRFAGEYNTYQYAIDRLKEIV